LEFTENDIVKMEDDWNKAENKIIEVEALNKKATHVLELSIQKLVESEEAGSEAAEIANERGDRIDSLYKLYEGVINELNNNENWGLYEQHHEIGKFFKFMRDSFELISNALVQAGDEGEIDDDSNADSRDIEQDSSDRGEETSD
jgi:hypothetical protein